MKLNCPQPQELKKSILQLADYYTYFCLLDSNNSLNQNNWIAGIGILQNTSAEYNPFNELSNFILANKGKYVFGHLNYDLKNKIEKLKSLNSNAISFAEFNFFVPEVTLIANGNELEIVCDEQATGFTKTWVNQLSSGKSLVDILNTKQTSTHSKKVVLKARTTKNNYINNCKKILEHLQAGDVYELNYCMEFFDDCAFIQPQDAYQKLAVLTEAPMSCFYKNNSQYLMCASPERFMKKEVNKLTCEPMKGTIRRGPPAPKGGEETDEHLKNILFHDEKERAENVMIVDLVRNDLSKVAEKGSVTVDELFGIYTFKTVHQMISTISCRVRKEITFTDILKALFPMGSMTGAPKIRAMELIEDYENAKRGLFSGSVGYIKPSGDFDFNVVIRSIFYNEASHYLSTWAGSAITIQSDPEKEYEECMLKMEAMVKALGPLTPEGGI